MKYTLIFCLFFSLSPLLYGQVNDTVKHATQLGDSLKFIDAISILKTEIIKHPYNADAYYWLGRYSHYLVYDTRPFVEKSDEWSEKEVLGNLKRAIYLNPNLGDAKYFLAVEYSARAREAIQRNHIEQAKKELLEAHKFGGFPDYIIAYSRSILQACDENAILFSNQDASVNAFMYVQLVEGFRKDISVITINLLERPFYIKYMRDGVPNEITKIPISWSDNLIMNMYGYFPWKEQVIKIKISPQVKQKYNVPDSTNEMLLTMKDKYGGSAMWIGTAAILNILENNKFERPIYCALPYEDDMFEFTDYLQNEGFVCKFIPNKVKDSANEYNKVKFESSVLNGNNYTKLTDIKLHNQPRANYFFVDGRRNIILDYVQFLIKSNKKEEAKSVYLKMNSLMPVSDFPLSNALEERCKKIEDQLVTK